MKKAMATVLTLAILIALTACGGAVPAAEQPAGAAAPAESAAPAGEEVVLRYTAWDKNQIPVYEELFRQFEAANPGIKVVTEQTSWAEYWTKLEAGITGKNAPDIFLLNIPRATDYIANGVVLPLDGLKVELDKFPAAHVEAYTRDGVLYGMPKDFDTMGLWYNKKLFDAAGEPYPSDDWTWEDYRAAAEKLTDAEAGVYGTIAPLTWQGGYYETIFQAGGWVFSEDGKKSGFGDPKTIEGVEFWYSLTRDGVSPPLDVIANTAGSDLFSSGKTAMFIEGSYNAPVFFQESPNKDDFDVAMVPAGPAGKACTSNALAHVIYAGSKYPEEAKSLIEFLSTLEANTHVAESGVVIPSYLGSQDAWVAAFPDKHAQALIDMVEFAVPLPNAPNAGAATNIEGPILGRAWSGEITIPDACAEVVVEAEKILNG